MTITVGDLDAICPGGAIGDWHGVFGFEADFASDLRCIPMCVRFKLDRVGIKLSLKQWAKLGPQNRHLVAALPCDTHRQSAHWRTTLTHLLSTPIVELFGGTNHGWMDCMSVPRQVVDMATAHELVLPTPAWWATLSTLQRFALIKLAGSDHEHRNFEAAMREFALISANPTADADPNKER